MSDFFKQLKHAFAVAPEESPLEKRLVEPLERLANAIVDRGMETPAILLFESMSPLNFMASQTMFAFWPFVRATIDWEDYRTVAAALENRNTLQRLVGRIEELALIKGGGR
jgi:hypothetical protein